MERNIFKFKASPLILQYLLNIQFKFTKIKKIHFSEDDEMASLKDNLIIDFIPKNRCDNYPKSFIMTYDLEFIARVMKRHSLKYTIDCTQDPNPMSEAPISLPIMIKFSILIFIQI